MKVHLLLDESSFILIVSLHRSFLPIRYFIFIFTITSAGRTLSSAISTIAVTSIFMNSANCDSHLPIYSLPVLRCHSLATRSMMLIRLSALS